MSASIPRADDRRKTARELFAAALAAADAASAVRRAVAIDGRTVSVCGTAVSSTIEPRRIVAVAFGKAAFTMAEGLDQSLGPALLAGIAVGPEESRSLVRSQLGEKWIRLTGGHPLPTERSIGAGRAVLEFVTGADRPDTAIIFLLSGGGSALVELPADPRLTVRDLATLNSHLLGSGAPIGEVNLVRRALSLIKGGRLSASARAALKLALIVSDVPAGDEHTVASGPTFPAPESEKTAAEVIDRYDLWERSPPVVREVLSATRTRVALANACDLVQNHVLLTSDDAVAGTASAARRLGFEVLLAREICDQEIATGCRELAARFRGQAPTRPLCLISAGEFTTPVPGTGRGGRNSETALRLALELAQGATGSLPFTALLGGTDGIDGNSPAAGAVVDEVTLVRARSQGLDPLAYLARSDSYSFFNAQGDAVITGPTGTNVRDLRILLGWPAASRS